MIFRQMGPTGKHLAQRGYRQLGPTPLASAEETGQVALSGEPQLTANGSPLCGSDMQDIPKREGREARAGWASVAGPCEM